jgi:phasin family protein
MNTLASPPAIPASPGAANLQMAALATATHLLYQGGCNLAQVNANAARAALEETLAAYAELMSSKSPQEAMNAWSRHLEPGMQQAAQYQQQLASILGTMQEALKGVAGLQRTSVELAADQGRSTRESVMPDMNPLAFMQSMLAGESNPYAQAMKGMQAAVQGMQAQFSLLPGMFGSAAQAARR